MIDLNIRIAGVKKNMFIHFLNNKKKILFLYNMCNCYRWLKSKSRAMSNTQSDIIHYTMSNENY